MTVTAQTISESDCIALFQEAAGALQDSMKNLGNQLLGQNGFLWVGENNVDIRLWNTNNQAMSWSTCNTALFELYSWMIENSFGKAQFTIYDGVKEVGKGLVE